MDEIELKRRTRKCIDGWLCSLAGLALALGGAYFAFGVYTTAVVAFVMGLLILFGQGSEFDEEVKREV